MFFAQKLLHIVQAVAAQSVLVPHYSCIGQTGGEGAWRTSQTPGGRDRVPDTSTERESVLTWHIACRQVVVVCRVNYLSEAAARRYRTLQEGGATGGGRRGGAVAPASGEDGRTCFHV